MKVFFCYYYYCCLTLYKFDWILLSYSVDCQCLKLFPFKRRNYIFVGLKNCFKNTNISVFPTVEIFPSSKIMATLRKKRKLAAMARETQEYPRNSQSQNSAAPGITEDYIAQVSEEIEGRIAKKLSQEFSRTKCRILGALSKLDEFFLNPQLRTFFETTTGTFRNTEVENQETSGDRSQNDPHPEVEFSACCASNLTDSDPDEASHKTFYMSRLKSLKKSLLTYEIIQ